MMSINVTQNITRTQLFPEVYQTIRIAKQHQNNQRQSPIKIFIKTRKPQINRLRPRIKIITIRRP